MLLKYWEVCGFVWSHTNGLAPGLAAWGSAFCPLMFAVVLQRVMKLGFLFFWRPFPCEDQQPPCNNFALQSHRDLETGEWEILALRGAHVLSVKRQSSLEPLVPCRAAAWQPMGHVLGRVQPGWKRASVSLGCRYFEISRLKTFVWEHIFSVSLQPSPICLAFFILLFYPLWFCVPQRTSSFWQGCLCTGTALTLPRLTYLWFLASIHCKILANNNHAFCSVAGLLLDKYPLTVCSLAERKRRAANSWCGKLIMNCHPPAM